MTDSPTDQQPGALARGVLQTQLEDARSELAGDADLVNIYTEQRDASQARVDALEAAIADLDQAAERGRQLDIVITGNAEAADIVRAIRDQEARR